MTSSAVHNILVIEDDRTLNRLLVDQLSRLGHRAQGAASRAEAMTVLAGFRPDVAILDLRLPDIDGLTFLPELREYCPVVILTAYGSIDQAVHAVRAGAADYLVKPVSGQSLELALNRLCDTAALMRDLAYWQQEARSGRDVDLVGDSAELAQVRQQISLFAGADSPVLILGESGAGKELIAHTLHGSSPRANGRMISVDCDTGLTAADLFGEVREGPAGRVSRSEGLIAAAHSGSIYLSHADRLAPELQSKLQRAIETGTYRLAGANGATPTGARFILSSQRSPAEITPDGNDLLFRLSTFTIAVPSLRERRADILPLAKHFLAGRNFQRNTPKDLSPEAEAALVRHDWPGNVRALRNAIERGIILSAGEALIRPEHLGLPAAPSVKAEKGEVTLTFDSPPTLAALREAYLQMMLDKLGGNRRMVAEILDISERNTYRLIRKDQDAAAE
jgi:DNA-binding NtrC family response regulator